MPEQDWFTGLDDARPLPAALRERLQEALLSPQSRELAPELSARLTARLGDPVADLLLGLDDSLPLGTLVRARLAGELATPPSRRAWWLSGAAAAAVAACLAVLVLLPGEQRSHDAALPSPTATATASPPSSAPVQPAPGSAGGVLVPDTGSSPTPRAPRPTPATPASQAVREPTIGVYFPPRDSGGSLPRTDPSMSPLPTPSPTPTPTPAAPPNVSARTPDAGPLSGGTLVRLYGYRLQSAVGIWFGTTSGKDFRRLDPKHVTVVSPPHSAANVPLVVRFSDGGQFFIRNGFTFVAPPTVDSVTPSSGSPAGGEWLVLRGKALSRVTTVRFDSTPARSVQVLSDTALRVLTPDHGIGQVDITVTSPGGTSEGVRFVYLV